MSTPLKPDLFLDYIFGDIINKVLFAILSINKGYEMNIDLVGEQFFVRFQVFERFREQYSRGDHGMGGGTYRTYYWTGIVTVTTQEDSKVLAVCKCEKRVFPHERGDVNKFIFSPHVLEGREAQFADLVGQRVVDTFQGHRERQAPFFKLEPPSHETLIQIGIAVDADEQLNAPLDV